MPLPPLPLQGISSASLSLGGRPSGVNCTHTHPATPPFVCACVFSWGTGAYLSVHGDGRVRGRERGDRGGSAGRVAPLYHAQVAARRRVVPVRTTAVDLLTIAWCAMQCMTHVRGGEEGVRCVLVRHTVSRRWCLRCWSPCPSCSARRSPAVRVCRENQTCPYHCPDTHPPTHTHSHTFPLCAFSSALPLWPLTFSPFCYCWMG